MMRRNLSALINKLAGDLATAMGAADANAILAKLTVLPPSQKIGLLNLLIALRKNIDSKKGQLEDFERALSNSPAQLEQLKRNLAQKMTAIETQKQAKATREKQRDQILARMQGIKSEQSADLHQLQAEKDKLREQILISQAQLQIKKISVSDELGKIIQEIKAQIGQKKSGRELLGHELLVSEVTLETLQTRHASLQNELKDLRLSLGRSEQDLREVTNSKRLITIQATKEQTEFKIADLESSLDSQKQKVTEAERDIASKKYLIDHASQEIAALNAYALNLETLATQYSAAQDRLAELGSGRFAIELTAYNQAIRAYNSMHSNLEDSHAALAQLEDKIEQDSSESIAALQRLETEIEALGITELSDKISELESTSKELQTDLDQYESRKKRLQSDANELATKISVANAISQTPENLAQFIQRLRSNPNSTALLNSLTLFNRREYCAQLDQICADFFVPDSNLENWLHHAQYQLLHNALIQELDFYLRDKNPLRALRGIVFGSRNNKRIESLWCLYNGMKAISDNTMLSPSEKYQKLRKLTESTREETLKDHGCSCFKSGLARACQRALASVDLPLPKDAKIGIPCDRPDPVFYSKLRNTRDIRDFTEESNGSKTLRHRLN